jgi:hypothetical protein
MGKRLEVSSTKSEVSNPQSEIRNSKSAMSSVQKMKSMVILSVKRLRKAKERHS